MKVAIHQPNFLPWMGYFFKIAQCDAFVLFDDAEFTKKSFIRRVKIHKPRERDEDKYLIVPLQKHSDFADISDLQLVNDSRWQHRIKAQIHQSYSKAPFYSQLAPIMDAFFTKLPEGKSFSDYTSDIIMTISEMLDLNPEWHFSHDLDINAHKANANIEMVKKINGSTYISGLGAKKYQTENQYLDQDIQLIYSDYPSYFKTLDIPTHFLNKSVISYLAFYEVEKLKDMLHNISAD